MAQATNYNYGLDAQLMSRPSQAQMAKELKQEQQVARQMQMDEEEDLMDDSEFQRKIEERALDEAFERDKVAGIKYGATLQKNLLQEAEDLRFDGLGLYLVLGLSVAKDLSDIPSLSLFGPFTAGAFAFILSVYFFIKSTAFKRFVMKRYILKWAAVIWFEIMPFTSFFPAATIATIMFKMGVDKKIAEIHSKISSLNHSINNLKKRLS